MILKITTPAFLFSTISLLMSAYGGRFSKIAQEMRDLVSELEGNVSSEEYIKEQIKIFSKRIFYIKRLQFFAILSLFFSALVMFLILIRENLFAQLAFIVAMIFFLSCLVLALVEIYYSMKNLKIN